MKDILESLREQYPLLEVIDPAVEVRENEDWRPVLVPEGMFEPMTEFLIRYVFVAGRSHKGEMGYQKEQNSTQVMLLKSKIQILLKSRNITFTMPFYGYTVLIVIDWTKEYESEIIEFSFIDTIKPTDQEAVRG